MRVRSSYLPLLLALPCLFTAACSTAGGEVHSSREGIPSASLGTSSSNAQTEFTPSLRLLRLDEAKSDVSYRWPGSVALRPELTTLQSAPAEGVVTELLVMPGQRVEEGQILAKIRSPRVLELQAERARAETQLRRAREIESTLEELVRAQAGSHQALKQAHADREQAQSQASALNSVLRTISTDSRGDVVVRALRSGTLFEVNVAQGQTIQDLERVLWVIAPEPAIGFRALVPVSQATAVEATQSYAVSIAGKEREASFLRAIPSPQAGSQRVEVWFALGDASPLELGHPGTLRSQVSDGKIRVPASALVMTREGQFRVWVREPSGSMVPKSVSIGASHGGFTIVESGLSGVEEIVISGALLLDASATQAL